MKKIVIPVLTIIAFLIISSGSPSRSAAEGTARLWSLLREIDMMKSDDDRHASAILETIIRESPASEFGYYARGWQAMATRHYDEAFTDFQKSIDINSGFYYGYYGRGHAAFRLGRPQQALQEFSAAIRINPSFVPAYASRAWTKNSLKDYQGAVSDHTRIIQIAPRGYISYKCEAYKNRGRIKYRLADYIGAVDDYTRALELNPLYVDAYYERAKARGYLRKQADGCIDLRKAMELGHPNARAAYNKYCR